MTMRPMNQLPEEGQHIIIEVDTRGGSIEVPFKYKGGIVYGFDGNYSFERILHLGWRPLVEADAQAEINRLRELLVWMVGDHSAPAECYSTGPLTGTPQDDMCPSCAAVEYLKGSM